MSLSVWWKVAVAVVASASVALGVVPAGAAGSDEARLLAVTNQIRVSKGLAPLVIDSQITGVAQNWAGVLAGRGVISHNPSLTSQVNGWKELGENVGVGGTVEAVHGGFVASPTHYANIVDPSFTHVGFGIVRPDARIFIVAVFMRPSTAAKAAPAAAAPAAPVSVAKTPAAATPVSAPPTAAPPTAAPAPVVQPAAALLAAPVASGEPSLWMVVSLDQLRSMEPGRPR